MRRPLIIVWGLAAMLYLAVGTGYSGGVQLRCPANLFFQAANTLWWPYVAAFGPPPTICGETR